MIQLRPYQQHAIAALYDWFQHHSGNPVLVLPTGSGKSVVLSELCRDAITSWPETRILVLSHVKEILEQDATKIRQHWPAAPLGVYSAGMGMKRLAQITVAGIQSIRLKAAALGHIDLAIIDECHLVSHKDEGTYRALIAELSAINPALRVVGLTATPWRLNHGVITEGRETLFSGPLVEPVSITELIALGHLCPLSSKLTQAKIDTTGLHTRAGEFIDSELQERASLSMEQVAGEIVLRGQERRAWLAFCAGVQHANDLADAIAGYGITTATVTGSTSKKERERILSDFKCGRIRCLTNANVLTTGFDYPGIDLLAMVRPTLSPTLYVQMAGRGMRPADGKADCLVLDFAGNVERHGPIIAVEPPPKKGEKKGDASTKTCPNCFEILHASAARCPQCGYQFPKEEKVYRLRNDDIMGGDLIKEMSVTRWRWSVHTSRTSGKQMLVVTYYGALSDAPVREYLTVLHGGWATDKALRIMAQMGVGEVPPPDAGDEWLHWQAEEAERHQPPATIRYTKDGQFSNVVERIA